LLTRATFYDLRICLLAAQALFVVSTPSTTQARQIPLERATYVIDDAFSRSWWQEAWAVGGRHESRKTESVNKAPVLAREMLFKCR
jgi:hypothetical protein